MDSQTPVANNAARKTGSSNNAIGLLAAGLIVVTAMFTVAGAQALIPSETKQQEARSVGRGDGKQAQKPGDHPKTWNSRVTDLVAFVERARGLTFKHPVTVRFMTIKAYEKESVSAESDLTATDHKDLREAEGFLKALGLIENKADLLDLENDWVSQETLAYYDHEAENIGVRGTDITLGTKVTLVHELTHALQDQWFDLSKTDDSEIDGEYAAFTALVEGDAIRIENEFLAGLANEDLEKLDKEEETAVGAQDPETPPSAVDALYASPYALGPQLASLIHAQGGNEAVDRAFKSPPKSEEHLIDPFSFLNGDEPKHVAAPKLARGEKKRGSGDFGSVGWLVTLSQRIDPLAALKAVDGWGGDSYLQVRRGSATCIKANFLGDTAADTDEMEQAMKSWVSAKPETGDPNLLVKRIGPIVQFESCSGPAASSPASSKDPLVLPATRSEIGLTFIQLGAPRGTARCIGQAAIDEFSAEELNSGILATEEPSAAVSSRMERATEKCD